MRTSMSRLQQMSPLDARCGEVGYVPECGDLIRLTFQQQAGHEQSGRRPGSRFQSFYSIMSDSNQNALQIWLESVVYRDYAYS